MEYIEFNSFKQVVDLDNPLIKKFIVDNECSFYIEPIFYTQLQAMFAHHKKSIDRIIDKMMQLVKTNKKVIFTGDFEAPALDVEGYVFKEITDVTDPLMIFVEDKSRGSDYGD
ncbi:MAG: hypothetical protein RR342_03330 [Bacilli bacterium]